MYETFNCAFCYPIYSDPSSGYTAALSGGSWLASGDIALANIQDRRTAKVARSTDATKASTRLYVDMGAVLDVRALYAVLPNASRAAKYRFRGFNGQIPIIDSQGFVSGWTPVGTPTLVSASLTDTGIIYDLIGDDSGAAAEYYTRLCGFTGNTVKHGVIFIEKGSSTTSEIWINDATAGANRYAASWTWSGNTPTIVTTVGTTVSATAYGNGWLVVFQTTAVTAANANSILVAPAGIVNAAGTGTLYVGPVLLFNGAYSAGSLLYDSGWLDVYRTIYPPGLLPVTHPAYADNRPTQAMWNRGFRMDAIHIPTSVQLTKQWCFEIDDTANADGYVDIGRLIIAPAYQTSINMANGAVLGLDDPSLVMKTESGTQLYSPKRNTRTLKFGINNTQEDEGLGMFFDMQQAAGITDQLLFLFNPTDTYHMHRRSFPCVFKELSGLEHISHQNMGAPFSIREDR